MQNIIEFNLLNRQAYSGETTNIYIFLCRQRAYFFGKLIAAAINSPARHAFESGIQSFSQTKPGECSNRAAQMICLQACEDISEALRLPHPGGVPMRCGKRIVEYHCFGKAYAMSESPDRVPSPPWPPAAITMYCLPSPPE